MKKTVFTLFLAGLATIIYSCSAEDKPTQETNSKFPLDEGKYVETWVNINNKHNAKRLGDASLLFTYTTVQQAKDRAKSVLEPLALETRSEISSVLGCTRIVYDIKFNNGEARLMGYYFIDRNDYVLESYILNPVDGTFGVGPHGDEFGPDVCPDGYSPITQCEHTLSDEDFMSCIGQGQVEYLNANLTSAGACAEIRYSISEDGNWTTLCGHNC